MSTEESRRLFHQHIDEHWHQGKRWDRNDPVLADAYTGHNLVAEVHGLAEYNAFNSGLRTAFPDLRINVDDEIAEGDRAAFRWTMRGTNRGALMGVPATGKPMQISGSTIIRVAGGRIVESWTHADFLGMFQQLGIIPALGAG